MPPRRQASVYQKSGELLVGSYARTTDGVSIAQPPVVRLSCDAPSHEVGAAVRRILEAFRDNVPHPESWAGVGKDFLKAAGLRSWRSLHTHSSLCEVEEAPDGSYVLQATRNGGTQGASKGFVGLEATTIGLDAGVSDAELGDAVLATLARCE